MSAQPQPCCSLHPADSPKPPERLAETASFAQPQQQHTPAAPASNPEYQPQAPTAIRDTPTVCDDASSVHSETSPPEIHSLNFHCTSGDELKQLVDQFIRLSDYLRQNPTIITTMNLSVANPHPSLPRGFPSVPPGVQFTPPKQQPPPRP